MYKCWVCDYSGKDLLRLVGRHGTPKDYESWASHAGIVDPLVAAAEVPDLKLELPEEYLPLACSRPTLAARPYIQYLNKRGVSVEDFYRWKIGFCPSGLYRSRVIIPSFSESGDLTYFVARSIFENNTKYLNPPVSKDIIFNELMIDWSKPITLVEGVFDALKFENSIPLLGSTLRPDSKLLQKLARHRSVVYLGLDMDAKRKEQVIIENMLLYGVDVFRMGKPEQGDYATVSKKECNSFKQNAEFVSGTDYLLYKKIFSEDFK